jgi:ABC-2 type transport system permease protein
MTAVTTDLRLSAGRQVRGVIRQPWLTAISMIQPVIWLLIFGSLFGSITKIPGFEGGDNYIVFLAPGVVVLTSLYAGGWSGMYMIIDMDSGMLDRMLASPMKRVAIMAGPLLEQAVVSFAQSALIMVLALLTGARFHGGIPGYFVMLLAVILLSTGIGALSNALALGVRTISALVTAVQFLILPLTFMSSSYMQLNLAPGWIRTIARGNPVDWTVSAARNALVATDPDWSLVGRHLAYLAVFAAVCLWAATGSFRAYIRSQ